ncbi:MAG: hypothetical protein MI724_03420, partial [Spirochaetales bacterium]|nr:hypothetical protein [Spirochaetales bacterium]
MAGYVLGIDAGTESVRAGIYDETGRCLAFGSSANTNIHEKPAWAEQSIAQWDASLVEAVGIAIRKSGVDSNDIRAVGVDGTSCTVVFLDEEGRPLRDAIMWMDVRSAAEAEEIAGCGDPALKYVGFRNVSAEWFPCKTLWVKRHEPDTYRRAHTIFEHTDWLAYRLTGEITANINTTTIRWFYNRREGGFPTSLYEKIGLGDIFPKLPTRILDIGEVVGTVSPEVAEKTGLPAGIPVAAGGADAYMGVIGVNALSPGRVALITGSSQLHLGLTDTELHAPGLFGSFPDAVIPGYDVVEAGQISTGSVLKWFVSNFVGADLTEEAARRGGSIYDVLNPQAAALPPGSEGLVVLEHWQGNRTPWVDAASRGVIRGLTLGHGPAHIYRAIMEGVVYGTAVILRRMEEHGFAVGEMIASGGATQSDLWMQLHADITGKPIVIPEEQQAVSLGSAIAGAVAADMYGSLGEAAAAM